MGRAPCTAAVASLAVVLLSATGRAAQTDRLNLADLVDRLGLTPAGARTWLDKLGARIGDSRLGERIVFVNVAGEMLRTIDGTDGRVVIPREVNEWLSRRGADAVLVHNHPVGTGLSEKDLMYLTMPGLVAVAAIGHEGSVYVAARGARHAGYGFGSQYQIAATEIEQRLLFYFQGTALESRKALIPLMLEHLVASALAQASVIEYRAALSPRTGGALAEVAGDADRAVAGAAQRLLAGLR
jgi:hypothetical protein